MKYLLDTNIIAYWLNGNKSIEDKICKIGLDSVCISFITLCELYFGAFKSSRRKENIKSIEILLSKVPIVHSNNDTAKIFGEIKSQRVKTGKNVDGADLLLASFALEKKLIFVTNNVKHFVNIENLEIENWVE